MFEAVHVQRLQRGKSRMARDRLDVSLGVVFHRRGPACDDGFDGAEAVFVLIGDKQTRQRTDAIDGGLKREEFTVSLIFCQPLPRVAIAADIARVVVADAARLFRGHGLSPLLK